MCTVVCCTNAIESVNARTRRAIRARGRFPNKAAAVTCVYFGWGQMPFWLVASLVSGLPLGAVGASIRRPGPVGILAALVAPVGAALNMVVLGHVPWRGVGRLREALCAVQFSGSWPGWQRVW
ncbi:transposase [Micromonospora chersina]|uniref:transposase n=1 Tax=Micromonospora chersina TaxID=47854 RepID=UPI003713A97E